MTIQVPLTLPALKPTSWQLELPGYPVIVSGFRSAHYPEILGSLPSDSRWTLQFENVTASEALALMLPWRATGMGLWPLTALPDELAAGVDSADFRKRLTGTTWTIERAPTKETVKNGRFSLTIALIYELTLTSRYGPRNPILAAAENPVLLNLSNAMEVAGIPSFLDRLLPAFRGAGPVLAIDLATIDGLTFVGASAFAVKAYRQFSADSALGMDLPGTLLSVLGGSASLDKSMAGPSGVLDLGQPTEMVPLSGDALISVLKTRQAQSIVDLAMPGDLISVIEFPTSGIDFSKVVLQIPGDGANNSTNIVDVSQNALTITRSGNPVITTSDPKCGTGSVQLRSSTFDRLAIDSSILNSLDQDFWIEFWLRRVDVNASDFYVNLGQDELQWFSQTSHLRQAWNAYGTSVTGDLELRLYMGGSVTNQANFYCVRFVNYAGNSQVFNHFCAGRVNGQLAAWFNGSISQDPGSVYGSAGTVNIGTRQVVATGTKTFLGPRNSGTGFNNYPSADVDDFRYVIDTPPWGLNNFTVPTSPHPVG